MTKDKLGDYSSTAGSNTDVGGVNIDEGNAPSTMNNAVREVMSHLADAYAAGQFALPNLLLNPNGDINQRGYSSGAATSGGNEYTIDGFKVVTSGQNLSWSTSGGVRTFTAPAGGVTLTIEGTRFVSGTHVISWTGTATATVDAVAKTSGETFTLTGGTDAVVIFSGGTFTLPKVERGSDVTTFVHKPTGEELLDCLRYLWIITVDDTQFALQAWPSTTAICRAKVFPPVPMRILPVLTATAAEWDLQTALAASTTTLSAIAVTDAGDAGNQWHMTLTVGTTPFTDGPAMLRAKGGTRTMVFSAEI